MAWRSFWHQAASTCGAWQSRPSGDGTSRGSHHTDAFLRIGAGWESVIRYAKSDQWGFDFVLILTTCCNGQEVGSVFL